MISEPVLIRMFRNSLRPSICAKAEQEVCQKNTWYQAIKKAITAEGKTALNLLLWVRQMDVCYPQGRQFTLKPTKKYLWD